MPTPAPDNDYSTLTQIRTKIRRLTRSPNTAQLSDDNIDNYINTFVLYDFPEHLRLFNLHSTFEFYTEPYQDVYENNTTDANDPLYNFLNKYTTINPPVYIAGYQVLYLQSQDQFFGIYPKLSSMQSIGQTGDDVTVAFTGVVNSQQNQGLPQAQQNICLLKNQVLFSSIDLNDNGLAMIDYPISASIGNLYVPGTAPTSTTVQDVNNYINYLTGQFVVTFNTAPGSGQQIVSQTVPQNPSLPQAVLFYDGKFTLRPVPDQPYKVSMQVYKRPTELLEVDQAPELSEWWQWIAYGASKKIFEDRMDLESVQLILPEFNNQMTLINRRTIVQNSTQRAQTIYSQQVNPAASYGPGYFYGGGTF